MTTMQHENFVDFLIFAQNKTPQKLTPFSQIKNSAFNGFVTQGRYTLDLNKNINMIFHWKKQLEHRYIQ